jgi:23S rRNA pseudouridine1911/1915/1917 synthase
MIWIVSGARLTGGLRACDSDRVAGAVNNAGSPTRLAGVSESPRLLEVAPGDTGRRLDVFLAERLGLSRAQTRRLLARGMVSVSGRSVGETAKGVSVRRGETVAVQPFESPGSQRVRAEPGLPLRVAAEGPGWLAADKPAGVPVHPLREDETGTLANAVIARHPDMHGVGEGALRSGVVHRLDVDTSGVVLFATGEPRWQALRAAFREHRVDKRYRAIALGRLEDSGEIALPLLTARHRPARVRVASEAERRAARGVREARLSWLALERFAGATLVEVRPVTGFLHQIRAIFSHLGHPLAGDRSYGGAGDATGAARHMLHASYVAVDDVAAAAPDAEDFAALLERLRAAP